MIRSEIRRPVDLIGHSNGGRISLFLASDSETKQFVRRLVLISPSGITPNRTASYYIRKYAAKILKAPFEMLPAPLREFGLDWLRHSLVWKLLGSSDYLALDGVMRETFVRTVTYHLDDRLDMIDAPTLLLWGENDSAVSKRQMRVLEDKIRDAGLVVLKNAGHYGYLDDYQTFIAATRHFLDAA
jgi:pimeloyl-ACP methyl ester carboxylesterase